MVKHKQIAVLFASLTLSALAAVPMTAKAGTETSTGKEQKAVVEEAKKSYISGGLGFTITNDYISRGIMQTPEAEVKAQPYLDLYCKLYDGGTGFVNNVTLNFGLWTNIEADNKYYRNGPIRLGPTGARFGSNGSSTSSWEEFDWMPGIAVTFEKNFTFTLSYYEFDYPNQYAFGPAPAQSGASRNINLNLAYNDTDLLGMWALHPHITFLQEVDGHAGMNWQNGGPGLGNTAKCGQYYEVGIAPAFTFMKDSKYAPTLTLPVTLGFGSNGFYGTGFGYVSAGGTVSVPLAFIPSGFGTWTANAGGLYYYMGPRTADAAGFYTFSGVPGSGRDRNNVGVAFAGVGLTF